MHDELMNSHGGEQMQAGEQHTDQILMKPEEAFLDIVVLNAGLLLVAGSCRDAELIRPQRYLKRHHAWKAAHLGILLTGHGKHTKQ